MSNLFLRNDGTFDQVDYASVSGTPSFTTLTKATTADVTLSSSVYTDGPSVTQGSSGTWFASGTVTLTDTASAKNIFCKLWDGTTVIDSAAVTVPAANQFAVVPLSGILASPAGSIKISCEPASASDSLIKFNASGNSKDSMLTVIRVG